MSASDFILHLNLRIAAGERSAFSVSKGGNGDTEPLKPRTKIKDSD